QQLRAGRSYPIGVAEAPLKIDLNIAADGPAALLESIPERCGAELTFRIILGVEHQHADASHALALLGARRQRPRRRRTAEQRDERAPSHHSITSSARASSVAGTSMPSAFAVLRLMTNSYLVGACTGRSAGFSPLRMRSTYLAAERNWLARSDPYDIRPPGLTK